MPRNFESIPNSRKYGLIFLCFGLYIILYLQYFNLQVRNYSKYKGQSDSNSIRKIPLPAPRGIIYDRSGIPIVDNMPTYEVKVIPVDVNEKFNYLILSNELNIPQSELISKIENANKYLSKYLPLLLKRHLDFEVISRLSENRLELPGILFTELPARTYPSDAKLTHVIGYLRTVSEGFLKNASKELNYNRDDIHGFAGLELFYESDLRGVDGYEYHLVDNKGIDHGILLDENRFSPRKGNTLVLTIDHGLQVLVENLLDSLKGSIICSNPKTGEIFAMASAPDYNLDSFVGPIPNDLWSNWNTDENRPLFNRAINGLYPPGSTLKLAAAAMLLETNKVSPNWSVNCNGVYSFGNRKYHCWNKTGHGSVNLKHAIKYSCNIYFYQLIQHFNLKTWVAYMNDFGYGFKTGIDLEFESSGLIPNKTYLDEKYTSRGWARGNLLSFVLGQGDVLSTPLQVLKMVNLIATNGMAGKLNLLKRGAIEIDTLDYSNKTWTFINDAMWNVVNGQKGTGEKAKPNKGVARGKTGTAENPHGEPHSWFTGYTALKNGEQLSVAIVIENGGKGSQVAAPMAKKIFNYFAGVEVD